MNTEHVHLLLPENNSNADNSNNSSSSAYLQIATPKSPNSEGFSPHGEDGEDMDRERELKQALCNELDVEILLKHREYNLVQTEIDKVQSQLSLMENLHDDPKYSKYIEQLIALKKSATLTLQLDHHSHWSTSSQQLNSGSNTNTPTGPGSQNYNLRKSSTHHDQQLQQQQQQHRTSYGGLRPIVDANGKKICVHKRSDGVIVRIDCPQCGRTDFGSAQGFLNHARLAHSIEYKSQEDSALQCGTLMPESEQDEIGISSIRKLKELGMDANKTLCPGVCIEEQVKKKRRLSSRSGGGVGGGVGGGGGGENNGTTKNTSHLAKLYSGVDPNHTVEGFKTLVEDVTQREEGLDDDTTNDAQSELTDAEEQQKRQQSFKKSHNRRKSRGGLSAVKFADDDLVQRHFKEVSPGDTSSPLATQILFAHPTETSSSQPPGSSGSTMSESSVGGYVNGNGNGIGNGAPGSVNSQLLRLSKFDEDSMTASQRRRVPTVSEPLRTRSRSSRESSH